MLRLIGGLAPRARLPPSAGPQAGIVISEGGEHTFLRKSKGRRVVVRLIKTTKLCGPLFRQYETQRSCPRNAALTESIAEDSVRVESRHIHKLCHVPPRMIE